MIAISVFEFYSHFGANPYVYMGAFTAITIVTILFVGMVLVMISRNVFSKIAHPKDDITTLSASITSIDIGKRGRSRAIFTDDDGEEYTLSISKWKAAFLSIGEHGELRFKGDKFIRFKATYEAMEDN